MEKRLESVIPSAKTHTVQALSIPSQLSVEELETLLRLQKDITMARDASTVLHVAAITKAEAVGPALWMNVSVEGVPV